MPRKRKVDVFAGKKSFADRLRQRRRMLEAGEPSTAGEPFKKKKKKNGHFQVR